MARDPGFGRPTDQPAEYDAPVSTAPLRTRRTIDQTVVEIEVPTGTSFLGLEGGYAIPRQFEATIRDKTGAVPPCALALQVRDGRVQCVSFGCGDGTDVISATTLRDVPLGTYLRLAIDAAAMAVEDRDGRPVVVWAASGPKAQRRRAELAAAYEKPRRGRPRTGQERPVEFYEQVAAIYRSTPRGAARAVSEATSLGGPFSIATAKRYIAQARDLGLIPPAAGRAGADVITKGRVIDSVQTKEEAHAKPKHKRPSKG